MDEKSELKAQGNQDAVNKSEPSRMRQHSGNVEPPPPEVKNNQPPPKPK